MNLSKELHIYIVAGEPSGDYLGGELINYLKKLYPSARFSGVGGTKMSSHRFKSLFNISDISVMGIVPVFLRIFSLIKRINLVKNDIIKINPDIVILIDSPDFNHRIAKLVKKLSPNIPIICYVAPSAWAWRQGRAK
jgi:lipid-A-disaccharide synthase